MSEQPETPSVCKVGGAAPKNYDVVITQGDAEIRLTKRRRAQAHDFSRGFGGSAMSPGGIP